MWTIEALFPHAKAEKNKIFFTIAFPMPLEYEYIECEPLNLVYGHVIINGFLAHQNL